MNARLVAITTILLLVISGCGYNPARDKDCPGCDLEYADLAGADLTGAKLVDANLEQANLKDANLDDVFNPDYSAALNVPPEYLKD